MKKLFIILSFLFITLISCNRPVLEKTYDNNFKADTVYVTNLLKFTGSGLYTKHCKMCHGNFGKGDGIKARTFKEMCPYDLSKENRSDQEIYYIIFEGIDTAQYKMPDQYELFPDDIWLIVFHTKKFRTKN